ncbi:MAG: branched-chain amino acid transport system permease protein livM [Candidatus Eremiobacteraeota bacterium]|jgi:branched-chain amino acid transport system permease protein|nr:branched-chain amino acid transport system permease protein livM [Candidatus Eremiobacteraeota bacterium]
MDAALAITIGGLVQGSVFALVAIGFALVFRVTGTVNLAQGAFVVLGALTTYSFEQTFGWPAALAALAALGVAAVIGYLVAVFIFAPGLRRLPPSGMVMLTGGLLTLFEGAALLVWGSQPYQLPPFSGYQPVSIGGAKIPTQAFWDIGITAVVVAALWYVLQRTTFGKALRACAENPNAATLMGIDVERVRVFSYTAAAVLGALSGIAIGPVVSLQFDGGRFFTVYGFISVAIGGMGSFAGALLGGLGIGVLQQLGAAYVSSIFATTLAIGLLIVVLVWRPNGLFGRGARREDNRAAAAHPLGVRTRIDPRTARSAFITGAVVVVLLPLVLGGGALSSLSIAGIVFIAVMGLDVLMGFAGQISLGHAAFVALGGYGAAIATVRYHMPPLAGIVVGLIASLACAVVLSLITVRLRGIYMALATLAFGLLVDSLAVGLSELTGGPSGLTGVPHFSIFGFTFADARANYYLVWGIALVVFVLLANLLRSDFGRALRAIRTDQTAALALGIDVPRYKLYAFLISAACASLAGSLYAYYFQFLSPDMVSTPRSLEYVTMLVIGGEGSLAGPLLGVLLLVILPTAIQPLNQAKTLFAGIVLVGGLLLLPQGILGVITAAVARKERRTTEAAAPPGSVPT